MKPGEMRVLVTGASGFIGSRVALHFRRLGIDAVFTGRDVDDIERARLRELARAGITVRLGDLREPQFVESLLQGRNAVLHLAAAQHESHMSDEHFRSTNLGATQLILEKCRAAGVTRFVYGSSMGVYGSSRNGTINDATEPQPLNIYTRTKLAAEEAVRAAGTYLEPVILRIGETYGPGDLRLLKLFRAIEKDRFVMLGDGQNLRQPIYVEDLIRGFLAALTLPQAAGETMVFAGNEPMTTYDMVGFIAAALQRPKPRWRVPIWPVLTLAFGVNTVMKVMRKRSPLHPRSLDFFRKSFVFTTTKAKLAIGFEPATRFVDGASATLDWYRAQGDMPERSPQTLSSTAHV
jgi:nucleoside-diphosphate-sugar epimerase